MARALLHAGFTADGVTIIATAAAVLAALTLFPIGRLFAGAVVIWFFVMFDMVDGAMARESGGGTRFRRACSMPPATASATARCSAVWPGGRHSASSAGRWWWRRLICLVTSQVISYIKARAEASGLRGDGGFIERPERLIIVLVGAGLSDLPIFPLPWALPVAMWLLAAASMVTCAQRLHTVRHSPGAATPLPPPGTSGQAES